MPRAGISMLAPVSSAKRRRPIEIFLASPVGNETFSLANYDGFNTAVFPNGTPACAREDVMQPRYDKFGPRVVIEGDVAGWIGRRRPARSSTRPARQPLKTPFCATGTRSPSRFAQDRTTGLPSIRAPKREGFAGHSGLPDRRAPRRLPGARIIGGCRKLDKIDPTGPVLEVRTPFSPSPGFLAKKTPSLEGCYGIPSRPGETLGRLCGLLG